jgi:hypothetical protein
MKKIAVSLVAVLSLTLLVLAGTLLPTFAAVWAAGEQFDYVLRFWPTFWLLFVARSIVAAAKPASTLKSD